MHKRKGYVVYVTFDATVYPDSYEMDGWLTSDVHRAYLAQHVRDAHRFKTEKQALKGFQRWSAKPENVGVLKYEIQHQP